MTARTASRRDARGPAAVRTAQPAALAPVLAALACAALAFAIYARGFGHDFVNWDDWQYVQENPLVLGRRFGALQRAVVSLNWHPLTLWSLALDVRGPLVARPFLVTNALLHALGTALAFALAWRLADRRLRVAAFVALVFALHPLHVESVAWVSERKDVLYGALFLGGLWAYAEWLERRAVALLALAFATFVLACLAKGMAVAFPLVLLLVDAWRRRPLDRAALLEKLPFFAVALLFGLVAIDVQAGGNFHGLLRPLGGGHALASSAALPAATRWLVPAYGCFTYVAKFVAPFGLCALHPYPEHGAGLGLAGWLAPLFVLAALGVAAWDARRSRIFTFGFGWYLATVVLVLQWLPVGVGMIAERYTYLPYFGLAFAWAMGIERALGSRRALGATLWVASAVVIGAFALLTARQIDTWRDSETLWSRVLAVHPRCALAYELRGNSRDLAGRTRDALDDFVAARALGDRSAALAEELATTYGALGRPELAGALLDEAIARDPARGTAWVNRAMTRLRLGRVREAVGDLDRALVLLPAEAADLRARRGHAELRLGDAAAAAADLSGAIAAGNDAAGTYFDRARCRERLGDAAGAAQDLREVLRREPANAVARAELAALGATP